MAIPTEEARKALIETARQAAEQTGSDERARIPWKFDLDHGTLGRIMLEPFKQFARESRRRGTEGLRVSRERLVGTATIVSDLSVMFTTRDWSVAGTLSTMAGALIMATTPN